MKAFALSIFILLPALGYALVPAKCAPLKKISKAICSAEASSEKCYSKRSKLHRCVEKRAMKKMAIQSEQLPDVYCVALYQPVCGRITNGAVVEFSNECEATLFDAHILRYGSCDQICSQVYNPVCGITLYGSLATFSSRCEARNNGASVLHRSNCIL